jgi:DNA-binding NtrC family response regulator
MKRILIVDDEEAVLVSLRHLLSADGVAVITCQRMEEAEEALERYQFDLVIADIRLSGVYGIEGLELLSYIRQRSPQTRVIIMTAYGSEQMRQSAYDRGAFHYYEKPVDVNDLLRKVRQCGIPVGAA